MLKIGALRAKDIRKIVLILYIGRFAPFPPTQLEIRVVLLHKKGDRYIIQNENYLAFSYLYTPIVRIASKFNRRTSDAEDKNLIENVIIVILFLGLSLRNCNCKYIEPTLGENYFTVSELTNHSKIVCMTYLKKIFDYE